MAWGEAACGEAHSAALTSDGGVLTWGCPDDGRLGLAASPDDEPDESTPVCAPVCVTVDGFIEQVNRVRVRVWVRARVRARVGYTDPGCTYSGSTHHARSLAVTTSRRCFPAKACSSALAPTGARSSVEP